MGLLVSQPVFKVYGSVAKFRNISKTAIMATIADCHFHALLRSWSKVQTSSTCRRTCPFPETTDQTFEERKSNKQLAGNCHNAVCYLARVEKIRMTPATSCKDREFSIPLREATSIVWIVFSSESSDFSWETKSLKLSGIDSRNPQSNRPQLDRSRENHLRLATCCCVSSIFVSRVSTRNGFRN